MVIQCKLSSTIKEVTNSLIQALDNSIDRLSSQSDDWRQEANDIAAQVTQLVGDSKDDILQTIKGDVINTVDRLPAKIGTEFRCDADFLRNRLKQDLQRIKAKLLGGNPPMLEPVLCDVVPSGVVMELKPNMVELFGYDLDRQKDVKVFLVNKTGRQEVTGNLSQPSHYHWVLNVGSNGVPFTANSNEIVVQFGDREVSSIPVIQPRPKICASKSVNIANLNDIDFVPPKIKGDGDFAGHGPSCYASIQIQHDAKRIWATVSMDATEWCGNSPCGDKTQARGQKDFQLWTAPEGFAIEKISSQISQTAQYIDTNHDPDQISEGGELVRTFRFIGDTGGNEAGTRTSVHIDFNKLSVVLKETNDCVSTTEIARLPIDARTFVLKNMTATPMMKAKVLEAVKSK
ncbi:hypothetical protein GCM10028809_32930 [Spirosoma gilvum]